jgi:hypothetical protein
MLFGKLERAMCDDTILDSRRSPLTTFKALVKEW